MKVGISRLSRPNGGHFKKRKFTYAKGPSGTGAARVRVGRTLRDKSLLFALLRPERCGWIDTCCLSCR